MRRIILACALAGVLAVPAKADETLKFRVVQYAASAQSRQVGDVNGHIQWFSRLPGLASFPDGSTARTLRNLQNRQRSKTSGNGTFVVVSGKGRYAGAKGDGTYEVTQNQLAAAAGESIGAVDVVLNIKK